MAAEPAADVSHSFSHPEAGVAADDARLGMEHFTAGRFEEAAEAFRRILESVPDDTKARMRLFSALKELGRPEEGKAELEAILARQRDHEQAHGLLGQLYREEGNDAKAAEHWQQAWQLASQRNQKLADQLAREQPHHLVFYKQIKHLARRFTDEPGLATGMTLLAHTLFEMGLGGKTLTQWQQRFLAEPRSPADYGWFAVQLADRHLYKEAARVLEQGYECYPDDVTLVEQLGQLRDKLPFSLERVKVRRRLAELKPESAEAHYAYGLSLLPVSKLEEGEEALRRAYQMQPQNVKYAKAYLKALDMSGKQADTLPIHRRLAQSHPGDKTLYAEYVNALLEHLGPELYDEAGRALEHLGQSLPRHAWVRLMRERLNQKLGRANGPGETAPPRLRFEGEVYCFLHLPRTGGTSMKGYLDKMFGESATLWLSDAPTHQQVVAELKKYEKDGVIPFRAFSAHMPYGIHDYIETPVRYVTVLREPCERVVSEYHYGFDPMNWFSYAVSDSGLIPQRKKSMLAAKLPIRARNYLIKRNVQTKLLAGAPIRYNPKPGSEWDELLLAQAMQNLGRMDVVCTTNHLDRLPQLLNERLGWNLDEMPRHNQTGAKSKDLPNAELVLHIHHLDVQLYQYAQQRMNQMLGIADEALEQALTPASAATAA